MNSVEAEQPGASEQKWIETRVRFSHYWPPWGGPNCATYQNGQCISKTASGAPWEGWIETGCACPAEWPFGTLVRIEGREWTCVDRGGKIVYERGIPWIDVLSPNAYYAYGQVIEAQILLAEAVTK